MLGGVEKLPGKWLHFEAKPKTGHKEAAQLCTHMGAFVKTGMSLQVAWEASWQQVFPATSPVCSLQESAQLQPKGSKNAPGQIDLLQFIAQACGISMQLGAPVTKVLEDIAQNILDIQQIEQAQTRSTAGPMISAKVLGFLPIVGICGSWLLGIKTLPWLIYTAAGRVCLALAIILQITGMVASWRLLTKTKKENTAMVKKIQWCLLANIALRAGASIPMTLSALGRNCANEALGATANELQVAVPWESSWHQSGSEETRLLQEALTTPWHEGVSAVPVLETAIKQERNQLVLAAEETAGHLGVQLVVPLGLCYLPAFVLVGLVPVMVLVGGQTIGTF